MLYHLNIIQAILFGLCCFDIIFLFIFLPTLLKFNNKQDKIILKWSLISFVAMALTLILIKFLKLITGII